MQSRPVRRIVVKMEPPVSRLPLAINASVQLASLEPTVKHKPTVGIFHARMVDNVIPSTPGTFVNVPMVSLGKTAQLTIACRILARTMVPAYRLRQDILVTAPTVTMGTTVKRTIACRALAQMAVRACLNQRNSLVNARPVILRILIPPVKPETIVMRHHVARMVYAQISFTATVALVPPHGPGPTVPLLHAIVILANTTVFVIKPQAVIPAIV